MKKSIRVDLLNLLLKQFKLVASTVFWSPSNCRAIWRWKYRDHEIWVRGHSRSLEVLPFEGLFTVSYSHSI